MLVVKRLVNGGRCSKLPLPETRFVGYKEGLRAGHFCGQRVHQVRLLDLRTLLLMLLLCELQQLTLSLRALISTLNGIMHNIDITRLLR